MAIYDKKLVELAVTTAEEKGIKWQYKNVIAGGNESSAFQKSACGAKVIAISAPARYIHSASNVLSVSDINAVSDLVSALNERSFD